jgi:hypothetical protein
MSGGIAADRETPPLCLANPDLVFVSTLSSFGLLHFHRVIERHFGAGRLSISHV